MDEFILIKHLANMGHYSKLRADRRIILERAETFLLRSGPVTIRVQIERTILSISVTTVFRKCSLGNNFVHIFVNIVTYSKCN